MEDYITLHMDNKTDFVTADISLTWICYFQHCLTVIVTWPNNSNNRFKATKDTICITDWTRHHTIFSLNERVSTI